MPASTWRPIGASQHRQFAYEGSYNKWGSAAARHPGCHTIPYSHSGITIFLTLDHQSTSIFTATRPSTRSRRPENCRWARRTTTGVPTPKGVLVLPPISHLESSQHLHGVRRVQPSIFSLVFRNQALTAARISAGSSPRLTRLSRPDEYSNWTAMAHECCMSQPPRIQERRTQWDYL